MKSHTYHEIITQPVKLTVADLGGAWGAEATPPMPTIEILERQKPSCYAIKTHQIFHKGSFLNLQYKSTNHTPGIISMVNWLGDCSEYTRNIPTICAV